MARNLVDIGAKYGSVDAKASFNDLLTILLPKLAKEASDEISKNFPTRFKSLKIFVTYGICWRSLDR